MRLKKKAMVPNFFTARGGIRSDAYPELTTWVTNREQFILINSLSKLP
jgi:hypothetical protein